MQLWGRCLFFSHLRLVSVRQDPHSLYLRANLVALPTLLLGATLLVLRVDATYHKVLHSGCGKREFSRAVPSPVWGMGIGFFHSFLVAAFPRPRVFASHTWVDQSLSIDSRETPLWFSVLHILATLTLNSQLCFLILGWLPGSVCVSSPCAFAWRLFSSSNQRQL